MTDNMMIAMAAINKWLYHSWNYETVTFTFKSFHGTETSVNAPKFIRDVKWTCNISHILEKWRESTASGDPYVYLVKFYDYLDRANRKLLLEWVLQNYNDERPLF